MKIFLSIALLSVGIILADWRSEQDPVAAKALAMDYFWQPAQVSGIDVQEAVAKFNAGTFQDVLGEMFFAWKDDMGNTFLHRLALKSKNVDLVRSVLSATTDCTLINNENKTAANLAEANNFSIYQLFELHEKFPWQANEYPAEQIQSEVSRANQKLFLIVLVFGALYFGWGRYNSQHNSVIV